MKRFQMSILAICFLILGLCPAGLAQDEETQRQLGTALSLTKQAVALGNAGRYDEAIPLAEQVLQIVEKAFGVEDVTVSIAVKLVADFCQAKGDYVKAEPLFKRALNIREKVLPADDWLIAESLQDLGTLYDNMGNYREAELRFKRAQGIGEKKLGHDHLAL